MKVKYHDYALFQVDVKDYGELGTLTERHMVGYLRQVAWDEVLEVIDGLLEQYGSRTTYFTAEQIQAD